jgi:hypothetical protein
MLRAGLEELVAGGYIEDVAYGDAHLAVALAADHDDDLRIGIAAAEAKTPAESSMGSSWPWKLSTGR